MKRTTKILGFITAMGIMLVGSYWLGTTQAKTDINKSNNIKTVDNGYIRIENAIPLDDIAGYYVDNYGYPCLELKDVGTQLDNPNNKSYAEILCKLEKLQIVR